MPPASGRARRAITSLPQEHRAFFEERGFTGDLDIDNFTVELEVAHPQAQHAGGNWRMGRACTGEWNQFMMERLREREQRLRRRMTVAEIMKEVESRGVAGESPRYTATIRTLSK